MSDNLDKVVSLDAIKDAFLVEKKVTCPFLGGAVAQGELPVLNSAEDPLASIEKVRELGNSGGGNLGDLLVLFASGNHAFRLGSPGKLDKPVPDGTFSLELPGSQGSHPGHSKILQVDPAIPGSGRLSQKEREEAFARLKKKNRAKDGWLKRSEVGHFIADNLFRDPDSKVPGKNTSLLLGRDLSALVGTTGSFLKRKLFGLDEDKSMTLRDIQEDLTKLLGEDNLLGSSGEFGLLFAFLSGESVSRKVDGEPAISLEAVEAMFLQQRLPDGWDRWKKTWTDWVQHTTGLSRSAFSEYRRLKEAQERSDRSTEAGSN